MFWQARCLFLGSSKYVTNKVDVTRYIRRCIGRCVQIHRRCNPSHRTIHMAIQSITSGHIGISPVPHKQLSAEGFTVNCSGGFDYSGCCSVRCGSGFSTGIYTVAVNASDGGADCDHHSGDTQSQPCNTQLCAMCLVFTLYVFISFVS